MSDDHTKFGENLKQFLIENDFHKNPYKMQEIDISPPFPDFRDFIGCSEEEIHEGMKIQNVTRLPEIYRQYLLVMGKQPAYFMIGSDVTFKWIEHLKLSLRRLIADDSAFVLNAGKLPVQLEDDIFVFFGQQGHTFLFFHTDNNYENPFIYRYSEYIEEDDFISGEIENLNLSLSDWFYSYARSLVEMRELSIQLMEETKKKRNADN